ncbi:hypothetical protein ACHHYP_15204 [Achlya hypogyna]|uniref:Cyclin-like domain-containing protein n=1 Tax=Achlya hypogyna TaxID=1202772 RepID=A0A1V9YBB9_ACHHY|nr:hypothetical protein ACHHYP_15204 [Achlya hypogyna]
MDLCCREDLISPVAATASTVAEDDGSDEIACLRARERSTVPNAMYLLLVQANGVNEASRDHICAWIAEVSIEFQFSSVTTALAINYLDRYLSHHSCSPHRLQLVGLVAIFVASKFHEKESISMDEAKEIAANVFTIADITRVENEMLSALGWKLHAVVPAMYLDTFLRDLKQTRLLQGVCAEISAVHHTSYAQLCALPSIAAVAIIHTAYDVHGLQKAPLMEYLARVGLPQEADECQRMLRMVLPSHLWKTKKRGRSPSPSGVDEILDEVSSEESDQSEAKRHKCC